ncbi:MAG: exodeoxyribonuclease VII large subunit [Acidimicrobiales bacterium]
MEERTYGVGELAGVLTRMLHQSFPGDVWVRGQIRNLSRSRVGHVYFELAEPGPLGASPPALIPVTLLAADRAMVNATMAGAGRMADGVEVRIRGRLGWFTPRGRLQLRMTGIDPAYTLGRLGEDRDRLLAGLRAEGLLVRNRGLPLAPLPLSIGLVTSHGSAAHADFLHELERSGFGFRVLVADARTQGLDAGPSVARAIALVVARGVDAVALVRGGGSRTDLAPFDGEAIARAVALASMPVLTGIGHEVDRQIADEVAHTRARRRPLAPRPWSSGWRTRWLAARTHG